MVTVLATDEPEIIPPSSSSTANPQLEEVDNVSSLLQKASQVAQGRELNFNQALQGILARLDVLDQRLETKEIKVIVEVQHIYCLLYTSPSPRDLSTSRMPSSA